MTQLGLKPIEDQRMRELKISNLHFHTFQNVLKTYKSLDDYSRIVKSEKEEHDKKVQAIQEERERLEKQRRDQLEAE